MDLPVVDITYKWNYKTYGLLCLASFTQHNAFKSLHVAAYIRVLFPFMDKWESIIGTDHILFIHSSVDKHLRYSHFLTITDSADITCVYPCCVGMFSFLLGIYLGAVSGPYDHSKFNLLRNFCLRKPFPSFQDWGSLSSFVYSFHALYIFQSSHDKSINDPVNSGLKPLIPSRP